MLVSLLTIRVFQSVPATLILTNPKNAVTAFAHALYAGDKDLTQRVCAQGGWGDVAREIGLPLLQQILAETTDTHSLVFVSELIGEAFKQLFNNLDEVAQFASAALDLLSLRYSTWPAQGRASVRRLLAVLTRKAYAAPYFSALPAQLCATAAHLCGVGGGTPATAPIQNDRITVCLACELLTDMVSQLHLDGSVASAGGHEVWVCHQLVRQQFDDQHLLLITQLVARATQRYIARADPAAAEAVLQLFRTIMDLFVDEDGDDDNEGQEGRTKEMTLGLSEERHLLRGVPMPASLHTVLVDVSLYQRLWTLQRSCLDPTRGEHPQLSATLNHLLTCFTSLPQVQVAGSTTTAASLHGGPLLRQQWLATALLQSASLLQLWLARHRIDEGDGLPARDPAAEEERELRCLSRLLSRIKPQYTLEEMLSTPSFSGWLDALSAFTRHVLLRPIAGLSSSRAALVGTWGTLATALACVGPARSATSASQAGKDSDANERRQRCAEDLGQRLDGFLLFYWESRASMVHSGRGELVEDAFEDTQVAFMGCAEVMCSRCKCADWKARVWEQLVLHPIANTHGPCAGTSFQSQGCVTRGWMDRSTLQHLVDAIWMQCAIMRVVEGGNENGSENAGAIASLLFQALSVHQRILEGHRQNHHPVSTDLALLDVMHQAVFHHVRAVLSLASSATQRRKESVVCRLNALIESEQDGRAKSDNAVCAAVGVALRGIRSVLRPGSGVSPAVRQLGLEVLEELTFTPRAARFLREVDAAQGTNLVSQGLQLLLSPQAPDTPELRTPAARYTYTRCVAQCSLQCRLPASSQNPSASAPAVDVLLQLVQFLQGGVSETDLWGLLCDIRAVLSCCNTPESYVTLLDALEPHAEAMADTALEDGVSCVGKDETVAALYLFQELVQNRQRRMNFEAPSVRSIHLVRFIARLLGRVTNVVLLAHTGSLERSEGGGAEPPSLEAVNWLWDATAAAMGMAENVLRGQFCNLGVLLLYNDTALKDLLLATWKLLSRITVADCVEQQQSIGTIFFTLLQELLHPFFDWFWDDVEADAMQHVLTVALGVAFGSETHPSLQHDSVLTGAALGVVGRVAAAFLPEPPAMPPGQKARTTGLKSAAKRADPALLERLLTKSVDNIFRIAVTAPSDWRSFAVSPSGSASLSRSAELLAVVMRCPETDATAVRKFMVSQVLGFTPAGSPAHTGLGDVVQRIFATLSDDLAPLPLDLLTVSFPPTLGARSEYRQGKGPPPHYTAVQRFIHTLNQHKRKEIDIEAQLQGSYCASVLASRTLALVSLLRTVFMLLLVVLFALGAVCAWLSTMDESCNDGKKNVSEFLQNAFFNRKLDLTSSDKIIFPSPSERGAVGSAWVS
eukprot:gene9579-6734_t